MKAISSDRLPIDDGWAAELKWDGMRIQATTDGKRTLLRSSNGRDVTGSFPELAQLGSDLGSAVVLDGEIVVFDGPRPSFRHLQQRIHVIDPNESLLRSHPIVYIVFDLLNLDGNSLLDLPYTDRRRLLDDFLPEDPRWRTPPYLIDGGAELLGIARERDLEGIMLKRIGSTYKPGSRSREWIKLKIRQHQEFVVGGWLAGQGELSDQMGSLMVGVWEDDQLVMAGRVGSGLTDVERARLSDTFIPRPDPPFCSVPPLDRRPGWVEPTVVVEVGFSEWPADGIIRHPTYLGLRPDRDPSDVVREIPEPGSSHAKGRTSP